MKKFIIAMLCVAVLFGFAACDNSTSNPADTDTTTSTPVSDAAQLKEAASKVADWLYDSDASIKVVDIIKNATFNTSFADGKLAITKSYPAGGDVVGEVTVVLSGSYTTKPDADGKGVLDVDDYTVSATGLQIMGANDYETVTFSITAPIDGVTVNGIKTDNTYKGITVDTDAAIYAPLPDQAAAASVTVPVMVSYSVSGQSQVPTMESKTFGSSDLVTAIVTGFVDDAAKYNPQNYVIGTVIGSAGTDGGYLYELKKADNLASLLKDVATKIGGTDVNGLTTVTPVWTVDSSKSEAGVKDVGTVTLTVVADEYKMGKATLSGTFTFTFDGTRAVTADNKEVVLTNLVITGDISLSGCGYPITIVSDAENHPVAAKAFTGLSAVLNETINGKVTSFTGTANIGDLTGIADVEGISYELPEAKN